MQMKGNIRDYQQTHPDEATYAINVIITGGEHKGRIGWYDSDGSDANRSDNFAIVYLYNPDWSLDQNYVFVRIENLIDIEDLPILVSSNHQDRFQQAMKRM